MIGAIIVTYNSASDIEACLDNLFDAPGDHLRVAVCDNASTDDTTDRIRQWAARRGVEMAEANGTDATPTNVSLTLVKTGANLGFAGGINAGLRFFRKDPAINLFWLVNPDCQIAPGAPVAITARATELGGFGLMGTRIVYLDSGGKLQTDGGRVGRWSGICRNANQGQQVDEATPPDPATLDYLSGASLVASRAFLDQVGLMEEAYFLYYEEVDWAARRGDLPLATCPEAIVYHEAGTSIGSGSLNRRANAFSNYFNYRNRVWFMRRFRPWALPAAYAISLAQIARAVTRGARSEAWGALAGLFLLPPPAAIRDRIAPADRPHAFGRRPRAQTNKN